MTSSSICAHAQTTRSRADGRQSARTSLLRWQKPKRAAWAIEADCRIWERRSGRKVHSETLIENKPNYAAMRARLRHASLWVLLLGASMAAPMVALAQT